MNKKILSIVSIVLVIALMATVLVACNAKSVSKKLEDAGYVVTVVEGDDAKGEAGDYEIKWAVDAQAKKSLDHVQIICFKKTADAKAYLEKLPTASVGGLKVVKERSMSTVYFGTEAAVKAAK